MNNDRLGIYYRMLNVAPGASVKEIKLAYRKLAFEYHPDRNTDPDAEEKFKDIKEAYEILNGTRKPPPDTARGGQNANTTKRSTASAGQSSGPHGDDPAGSKQANRTRRGFAGSGRKPDQPGTGGPGNPGGPGRDDKFSRANEAYREQQARNTARKSRMHPGARRHHRKTADANAAGFIQCAITGVVSAQPRMVEFTIVRGFLNSRKIEKVVAPLAPKGARRLALRASLITWLRGFWGWRSFMPAWRAIVGNMRGGTFPPQDNAKLLFTQANAFEKSGNRPLARAVLLQARDFIGTNRSALAEQIRASIRRLDDGQPARRVRDEWKQPGMFDALLHLSPLFFLIFAALVVFGPGQGFVSRDIPRLLSEQGTQITRDVSRQLQNLIKGDRDPYYVDRDLLNMREGPGVNHKIIRRLTRFETVYIIGDSESFWIEIETSLGEKGFINLDALVPGSGSAARDKWCAQNSCD